MSGCPSANLLALLADGTIAATERAGVERHLDSCVACGQLITELAWVIAPPRSAPPRYRIVRAIGDAWLAEDLEAESQVVLQFVEGKPERRSEIERAATKLVAIRRPGLVPIERVDAHGDEVVIATPVTTEVTARAWRDNIPSRAVIIALWRSVILEVAGLHADAIVHGALSPDQILVGDDGSPRVGGFGATSPPAYRAVELLHGGAPSRASDQFALCVALWEALTGKPPYAGATVGALAVAMTVPLAPPADDDRALFAMLARGLDPDPAKRWPDLRALVAAIDHPALPGRRWFPLVAGAALVAAAVAAIAAFI